MDEKELVDIEARAEKAKQEVYALCIGRGRPGGKDFSMSIPPQEDRDSDFVLLAPPRDIPNLIAALRIAQSRVAQLEAVLDTLSNEFTKLTGDTKHDDAILTKMAALAQADAKGEGDA